MTDHTSKPGGISRPSPEECAFCEEHLEAHAVRALDPVDRARFDRHIQWCGPCRRALAETRAVTDLLPFAVEPMSPSPQVKSSLLQRIEAELDAEPVTTFGDPWAAVRDGDHDVRPPSGPQTNSPSNMSWLTAALVAPLAIALIMVGAWANSLQNDLEQVQAQTGSDAPGMVAQNAPATQMQLYSMEPSCDECDETPASGQLGGNPDDNVGILVAWNLSPNERHQVWCEDRDGRQLLVSDFEVAPDGEVIQAVQFPDAIGGYTTIYVTRHDGTEEMRVALTDPTYDDAPANGTVPASN